MHDAQQEALPQLAGTPDVRHQSVQGGHDPPGLVGRGAVVRPVSHAFALVHDTQILESRAQLDGLIPDPQPKVVRAVLGLEHQCLRFVDGKPHPQVPDMACNRGQGSIIAVL